MLTFKLERDRSVREVDIDIHSGQVTFKSGHYVYADNNGIIVCDEALV